ncbi:MAG: porin family protein [Candidatus Krumholzibacteria bacterium]|nr:porin family protein [Candidatus Krumholzibacteria bacterium]
MLVIKEKHIPANTTALLGGIGLLLFGLVTLVAPAMAHDITPERGFYVGARVVGSGLDLDQTRQDLRIDDDGGGIVFDLGYGFNEVFSLEISLGGLKYDTTVPDVTSGLGTLQIVTRYRFLPHQAFRPYVKGGLAGYTFRLEQGSDEATFGGGGLTFGGGADYFFTSRFAMGIDLMHNVFEFEDFDVDPDNILLGTGIDDDASMTWIGLSALLHF